MPGKSRSLCKLLATGWLMIAAAGVSLLLPAGSVHAAIVVTNVTSSTEYGTGHNPAPTLVLGASGSVRSSGEFPGNSPYESGLDFNTTVSTGAFYFLHNEYCVGQCDTVANTIVTITLANDGANGPGAEASRFDTDLTPGHLARAGAAGVGIASFDFGVSETIDGKSRVLYSASGEASPDDTSITTSDGSVFNGLFHSRQLNASATGEDWNVFDWSATNLNLMVDPIAVGQTATLTYQLQTDTVVSTASCTDISTCPGVQIAFGDPRHNGGGVTNLARARAFAAPLAPVIGGLYDAVLPPIAIVAPDAPLPPEPPVIPPVNYGAPFVSQIAAAVPEPTSWMLMIAGFGVVGMALRRRAIVSSGEFSQ